MLLRNLKFNPFFSNRSYFQAVAVVAVVAAAAETIIVAGELGVLITVIMVDQLTSATVSIVGLIPYLNWRAHYCNQYKMTDSIGTLLPSMKTCLDLLRISVHYQLEELVRYIQGVL